MVSIIHVLKSFYSSKSAFCNTLVTYPNHPVENSLLDSLHHEPFIHDSFILKCLNSTLLRHSLIQKKAILPQLLLFIVANQ